MTFCRFSVKFTKRLSYPSRSSENLEIYPFHAVSTRKVESNLLKLLITDLNLGKGEADVIALASQTGLKVVIDDSKARKVAEDMGLRLTGTIGVLIKAERLGLIRSAHDKVTELRDKGFYVSEELLEAISRFK